MNFSPKGYLHSQCDVYTQAPFLFHARKQVGWIDSRDVIADRYRDVIPKFSIYYK